MVRRRTRQHETTLAVIRQLGTSVRQFCIDHNVTRSALYRALDGDPWARRYVTERLGSKLARALGVVL